MSLMCIVCRDPLTTNPSRLEEEIGAIGGAAAAAAVGGNTNEVLPVMVVTRCGHTYHEYCLTTWFNRHPIPRQECPFCKSSVKTNDYQKIYAVGDEETEEIVAATQGAANARSAELATLRDERTQIHVFLADSQKSLESEQLAHDILKFDFVLQQSELQSLKNEKETMTEQLAMVLTEIDDLKIQCEKLNTDNILLKTSINKAKKAPKINGTINQKCRKALECVSEAQKELLGLVDHQYHLRSRDITSTNNNNGNNHAVKIKTEPLSSSDDSLSYDDGTTTSQSTTSVISPASSGANGRKENDSPVLIDLEPED